MQEKNFTPLSVVVRQMNGTIMIVTVLLFATFPFISQCANILILHPIYCGSHELVLRSLGDLLVNRGHQVTQV